MRKPGRDEAAAVDIGNGVPRRWQRELARAITSVEELLTAVGLDAQRAGLRVADTADFPLRVPRGYVARMRRNDPDDPLLRQVLPLADETEVVAGFGVDPVGDLASMRSRGLLQKYHGRALLIVTGACALHCRYCFRRAYPYGEAALAPRDVGEAMARIERDETISEVILSGGDPLSLANHRLRDLVERIGRIRHVRRIRLHTRQPIVLPERVDAGLLEVLERAALPTVVVVHSNHANEIDAAVADALARLAPNAAALLNQSVLLRGINDSAAALVELSERLFDNRVLPYYLHQLDPVVGAAHFAVSDDAARRVVADLRARLPGYLVPKLVREIPGESAKSML